MNNSRKIQPRKVYFTIEQVAFKMKVENSHIVEMMKIFGIKPKIKNGRYKLTTSEIEIFYRIQLLRDWGHKDKEILSKKMYTDLPFMEIFNKKKSEEIKNKNKPQKNEKD